MKPSSRTLTTEQHKSTVPFFFANITVLVTMERKTIYLYPIFNICKNTPNTSYLSHFHISRLESVYKL